MAFVFVFLFVVICCGRPFSVSGFQLLLSGSGALPVFLLFQGGFVRHFYCLVNGLLLQTG